MLRLNFTIATVIAITIYSPSCLGQETAKGPFGLPSQAATCPPVYYTRWRLHTLPLIGERQAEVVKTNFYSLWFDQTGNQT